MLLRTLRDFSVGVAHDGDDHVEGSYLSEESGKEEEKVDKTPLWTRSDVVEVKFSQWEQVLVDQCVKEPPARLVLDYVVIFYSIDVEDVQRRANGQEEDWENQEERRDVNDSRDDQLDVEGRCVEHSQPVKHLGPDKEQEEGAHDASRFWCKNMTVKDCQADQHCC